MFLKWLIEVGSQNESVPQNPMFYIPNFIENINTDWNKNWFLVLFFGLKICIIRSMPSLSDRYVQTRPIDVLYTSPCTLQITESNLLLCCHVCLVEHFNAII